MDTQDPISGATLENRYVLGARLAGGRVGGVYRATDLRTEREVAVRVIAGAGLDADARARLRATFRSEARTAVRLSHPNLVQVHDYGSDDRLEIHYLVTELLEPLHLGAYLRKYGPPPPAGAAALILDAARGLAAAHTAGLVHRDVRPGSLLLADGGGGRATVRLVDLARVDADAGGSGSAGGYAAPERRAGEPCTPAADVYALAATALHTLTGRTPPSDDAPRLLLEAARRASVPQPLLDVLATALSPEPGARHRDGRDFAEALEAALEAAGIAPAAPPLKPRRAVRRTDEDEAESGVPSAAPAAPRARARLATAAAALLVAGGVLAVLLADAGEPGATAVAGEAPSLARDAAAPRSIAPGETVSSRFTAAEPAADDRSHYHLWRLEAAPGQRVRVGMHSRELDAYLVWGVVDGDRWEERGSDDDSGEGRDAALWFTVPPTGTPAIRATTFTRGERGAYTLSVESVPVPAPLPIQVGETVRGRLTDGSGVDDDGAFYDLYVVQGAPGARVVIDMRSRELDAYLVGGRLVDGAFAPLVRNDDGGSGTDARLTVRLDEDGRYAVLARSYAAGRTGAYTLVVSQR